MTAATAAEHSPAPDLSQGKQQSLGIAAIAALQDPSPDAVVLLLRGVQV